MRISARASRRWSQRDGYRTREAANLAMAREQISEASPDLVLLDIGLPDGNGLELISDEGLDSHPEFVVMTGDTAVETAIAALREGALDYLPKPVDRGRLQSILTNVARTRGLKRELKNLRGELRELGRFGPMVGRSKAMQQVYDLITRVAPTESTVFVTGESGTGKELVAETVHRQSRRKDKAFLARQLRRDDRLADRERALRTREGELHRRRSAPARLLRGSERRHALPRRDHGDADRAAGEAAARPRDRRDHPRGGDDTDAGRRPRGHRLQSRSQGGRGEWNACERTCSIG